MAPLFFSMLFGKKEEDCVITSFLQFRRLWYGSLGNVNLNDKLQWSRKRRRKGKGDYESVMINASTRNYTSVHREVRVTTIGIHMVQPSMHGQANMMEGVIMIHSA